MADTDLETRIRLIEDELAIRRLMDDYCRRADAFNWEHWSETFTEDAEFDFDAFGTMRGRQEILNNCRAAMDPTYQDFIHYIVNVMPDVDGDTATATGNIIFAAVTDASKPAEALLQGGRYRWKFVRTADGWRIAHTLLRFIWNNGADAEGVFEVEDQAAA